MSDYTEFSITWFDSADGSSGIQKYRWSWQTCPFLGDQYIVIEADTEDGEWLFEEGLNDKRELSQWVKGKIKQSQEELACWETDQAELA